MASDRGMVAEDDKCDNIKITIVINVIVTAERTWNFIMLKWVGRFLLNSTGKMYGYM
jgi:hypothetical protein